tara:strand:- start:7461 stop:8090 length:630 start_codon:yes stop_codon:yes gene_type:complete
LKNKRREYKKNTLSSSDLPDNPLSLFGKWLNEVEEINNLESASMVLSTIDENSKPTSRTVLLKDFNESGFIFYTNYDSPKAEHLEKNPHAALLFYWPNEERQIRIRGRVSKISKTTSEKYFHTRPRLSQLAAWVSKQSQKITNRKQLEDELATITTKYENQEVPLPDYWGGYSLSPVFYEFWQGRRGRLHDRFSYTLNKTHWSVERLAP